jgi:hypothetical protein
LCISRLSTTANTLLVTPVRSSISEVVSRIPNFRQATLTFFAIFLVSSLDLGLFRRPFGVLVEGDRWSKDGLVEFLELVGVVFSAEGVVLGDIEVAFGISKFLYRALYKIRK